MRKTQTNQTFNSAESINLLESWWISKSAKNFYAYRQYIGSKDFKTGWFQRELSMALQQFYLDLKAKKRPILIIEAPPQHGKSRAVNEFLSWLLGKMPSLSIIFASYSDRLGVRANRFLQRTIDSQKFQNIFENNVQLGTTRVATLADRVLRNNEIFELVGHEGSFRNTTVNGSVTGESLDLGVIDDPVKGRAEANSKTIQEKTWDWFTDDFYTRFSEYAGLLLILTRWSVMDLAARLKESERNVKTVTFRAIAQEDEEHRERGEALFPEHKSLDFLKKRKKKMSLHNWEALYQQNPVLKSGNIFNSDNWRWYIRLPAIRYKFIVVDTAQKKNNWNDFTDFQCWGHGYDNCIYLLDHVHDRIEAPELRKLAEAFYQKHDTKRIEPDDPLLRGIWIEDKSSGIGLIQELRKKKLKVNAIPRSVDKIQRAFDTTPYISAGQVFLNEDVNKVGVILGESVVFPNGLHDDAIDNVMNAIDVAFISGTDQIFIA